MKRYFFLITIALFMPFLIQAQDLADALRYSSITVSGTARSGAMGNAFGALGGDFTSASINPAGIGLYRSSELTITPISGSSRVESIYYGTGREDSDYKFSLSNMSYVYSLPISAKNEAGIVSVNLGMGYNRVKDFNSNSIIQGFDVNGSYMDYFADRANNGIWSDFYEELAWKTDMLLYDENNNEYYTDLQDANYGQSQRKTYSKNGSIDEYSFVMGLNFNHKLYMGMAWGINDLYYSEGTSIYENDDNNNIPYFNNYQFNSYFSTYGIGHNFKFGAIYKPVNEVRLGVSVHTPTYYRLYDDFNTMMSSYITYNDGSERYEERSPYNEYNYRLQTPMRTTFSGAVVIGKKGLISADYELVNYGMAKLRNGSDGYSFYDENAEISEAYKTSGNVRIGGELMATSKVSIRGGFEYHGSAYNETAFGTNQLNADSKMMVYSGGIGYRSGSFFADLTYRYSNLEDYDYPYPTPVSTVYPEPEAASFKSIRNDILFTLGFKF
ncbi:MAG: hypothetical protein EP310_05870 [Bacteroidetes bacterium]|nr:MAG: hypothetical protein EP310_05870 [Bacteroidota bacterium]